MTTLHSDKLMNEGKCIGTAQLLWIQTEFNDFSAIALSICAICPVRKECEEWVRPASSYFDGVAAGHIYKHGRQIL